MGHNLPAIKKQFSHILSSEADPLLTYAFSFFVIYAKFLPLV
jgi:hypothetical protein